MCTNASRKGKTKFRYKLQRDNRNCRKLKKYSLGEVTFRVKMTWVTQNNLNNFPMLFPLRIVGYN